MSGSTCRVVIDTAGGKTGGAGRFREQLDSYLSARHPRHVAAIGADHMVEPKWLARREWLARGSNRVVAANNVSFGLAGEERWVLVRNANHFLTEGEWAKERAFHPAGFARQVRIVRRMLQRADRIVAPSNSMAERVVTVLPTAKDRVIVRYHPLRIPPAARHDRSEGLTILCPLVDAPYKKLDRHLVNLRAAVKLRDDVRVVCTTHAERMPAEIRADSRFQFVGVVDRAKLAALYESCSAVYYPTEVESFGYPLAEARAAGRPVIALDLAHNRDVAGSALFAFRADDVPSLRSAVYEVGTRPVSPDPAPFDPDAYFDWLLAR